MKRTHSKHKSNASPTRRQVLARLVAAPIVFSGLRSDSGASFAGETSSADSPDAIVIGAGAIGCNTAWHLRQRGLRVLVLDAQAATASQSTNGAAGFVASWAEITAGRWKKTEWEMQRYGIDFYTQLAKRAKADIGFSPSGIVYIYETATAWKKAQPRIEAARKLGTKLEVLTAERAKNVVPFLEFSQIAGIVHDPDAIRVRAGDAIRELAKELAADGMQFQFNTRVTDFLRDGKQIVGVRTDGGEIRGPKVIVTAGAWSRPLLAKLKIECPSAPRNETRYVTKPIKDLPAGMPLLIFNDHQGLYIREEQGGLLIGGGEDSPLPPDRNVDADNPPWCDKLPPDQAYRVQKSIGNIARLMPVLHQAEFESVRSGMPTYTRDTLFIAGPVPDVAGLFVMSGCQVAGVTHGPALGRILAEHAVDGKTHWDSSRFGLQRFAAS